MRIFKELSTSYATQENAIKAATKKLGEGWEANYRWFMVVTENGRFQVCIQGDLHLVHAGFCVVN